MARNHLVMMILWPVGHRLAAVHGGLVGRAVGVEVVPQQRHAGLRLEGVVELGEARAAAFHALVQIHHEGPGAIAAHARVAQVLVGAGLEAVPVRFELLADVVALRLDALGVFGADAERPADLVVDAAARDRTLEVRQVRGLAGAEILVAVVDRTASTAAGGGRSARPAFRIPWRSGNRRSVYSSTLAMSKRRSWAACAGSAAADACASAGVVLRPHGVEAGGNGLVGVTRPCAIAERSRPGPRPGACSRAASCVQCASSMSCASCARFLAQGLRRTDIGAAS